MKRRCVFLDRDGVINVKPPEGEYVNRWSDFAWVPGIADWIRLFNALDLLVIVVTNQRGVARGLTSEEALDDIHRRMKRELARRGARLDDIFVCPHERGCCDCRKPQPGLIHQAQEKWKIDLERSLLIGDSVSDEELAARCRLQFVRVLEGRIVKVCHPPESASSSCEVGENCPAAAADERIFREV